MNEKMWRLALGFAAMAIATVVLLWRKRHINPGPDAYFSIDTLLRLDRETREPEWEHVDRKSIEYMARVREHIDRGHDCQYPPLYKGKRAESS